MEVTSDVHVLSQRVAGTPIRNRWLLFYSLDFWMAVECNDAFKFGPYLWVGTLGWLLLLAMRTELDVLHSFIVQLTY